MCGIIAMLLADASDHVAPLIVDGLTVLQHRGQGGWVGGLRFLGSSAHRKAALS